MLKQPTSILVNCISPFLNLRELTRLRSTQSVLRERLLTDQLLHIYSSKINCIVWVGAIDDFNTNMIFLLRLATERVHKMYFDDEAGESIEERDRIGALIRKFRGHIYFNQENVGGIGLPLAFIHYTCTIDLLNKDPIEEEGCVIVRVNAKPLNIKKLLRDGVKPLAVRFYPRREIFYPADTDILQILQTPYVQTIAERITTGSGYWLRAFNKWKFTAGV